MGQETGRTVSAASHENGFYFFVCESGMEVAETDVVGGGKVFVGGAAAFGNVDG